MRAWSIGLIPWLFAGVAAAQSGACCEPSGACAAVTAEECPPGAMHFAGSVCTPNPCPLPARACCLPDTTCEIEAPGRCVARGGWVDQSDTCVCPPPEEFGACCAVDLEPGCAVCHVQACAAAHGVFQGGVACDPIACPTAQVQACCLVNQECVVSASWLCRVAGGRPLADSACWFAVCTELDARACCFEDGTGRPLRCEMHGEFVCRSLGGSPGARGTLCQSPAGSGNFVACCPANFNAVGGVTVQDVFDFLGAFFAGEVRADIDHSGVVSLEDVFVFLAAYFAGCE